MSKYAELAIAPIPGWLKPAIDRYADPVIAAMPGCARPFLFLKTKNQAESNIKVTAGAPDRPVSEPTKRTNTTVHTQW